MGEKNLPAEGDITNTLLSVDADAHNFMAVPSGISFEIGRKRARPTAPTKDSVKETGTFDRPLEKNLESPTYYTPCYYQSTGRKMQSYSPPKVMLRQAQAFTDKHALEDVPANVEVGSVFEMDNSLWVKTKENEIKKITNFTVGIIQRVVKHRLHGNTSVCLEIRLSSKNRNETYLIPDKKIMALIPNLEKDKPYFYLDTASFQKALPYFKRHLAHLLETQGSNLPIKNVYCYAGWNLDNNNRLHYWSKLDPDCESDRMLADLSSVPITVQNEANNFAWGVLKWGVPQVMIPIFLHSFSGILFWFFKNSGHPIRHILNICGPTGSGKTMLMELLYRPFDPERRMPNFTATAKGIELFCEENHDSIVPIDDMSSETDKNATDLVETLLRRYCDGQGHMVSTNGGKELFISDMSLGLAISSEMPIAGNRLSSGIRLLKVEVDDNSLIDLGDIKQDTVKCALNGVNYWDIFQTQFIRYVESQGNNILETIIRHQVTPLDVKFRRHEEVYFTMTCIGRIVLHYFVNKGYCDDEDPECIYAEWCSVITDILLKNQEINAENDPVQMFLTVLNQGIAQSLFPVAIDQSTFVSQPQSYFGYWTDGPCRLLFLDPLRIFSWVAARLAQAGIKFSAQPKEVWRKMVDHGLTQGYKEKGRSSPRPLYPVSINKKKTNLLAIYWDKVKN